MVNLVTGNAASADVISSIQRGDKVVNTGLNLFKMVGMNPIKRLLLIVSVLWLSCVNDYSQSGPLKSFPLSSVRLLESPFLQAQQADMDYILTLDPDRLLAPFLIDAGIDPKASRYPNWENTGLDGHIGGHYLSALSLMYASTKNEVLLARLNYMIEWLDSCQRKNGNGYVGGIPGGQAMWNDIAGGIINASAFSLNNKWVPLYNIHKLYAGLRDAYLVAGNVKALEMLIKLTDWCIDLTKNLSDQQVQKMLSSEHGGLNEVFADVSEITGEEKYLALAKRFSHLTILNPLLAKQNKLTGLHANTQIPKVVGYKRIADLAQDSTWEDAASYFWSLIYDKWTISIGGNSVEEHLHPANDFSTMVSSVQGPETCNTYNMLRLTKLLFLTDPQTNYMDYYERALYNHILSSENPEKGGFVYFTPMRPGHYRVYSQPHQSFWCCVGSGMENHGKYGEMIYTHNDTDIYINLFIPSRLEWTEKGIEIEQITSFPYEEKVTLRFKLDVPEDFAFHIRYPKWVKEGGFKIWVNGTEETVTGASGVYVAIKRHWNTGDSVEIALPAQTKAEYLPDGSPWASIVHGPVVMATKTGTNDLTGLFADDSRWGHVAGGQLYSIDEAPAIITNEIDFTGDLIPVEDKPLTLQYTGKVEPDEFNNFELVPFFSVHESRYVVYFQVKKPEVVGMPVRNYEQHEKTGCWPNPFTTATNINFNLTNNQKVSLIIYNSNGVMVETLVNKEYQQGENSIVWNASTFKKGIYFCKLKTDESITIKKLVLQ